MQYPLGKTLSALLTAMLCGWAEICSGQSIALLVSLYDKPGCAGEEVTISKPMFRLEEINWANRTYSLKIHYGIIQVVSEADNAGLRWPDDRNSNVWFAGQAGACVNLPPWIAGKVRGIASFGPNEKQRACLRDSERVWAGDVQGLNDALAS